MRSVRSFSIELFSRFSRFFLCFGLMTCNREPLEVGHPVVEGVVDVVAFRAYAWAAGGVDVCFAQVVGSTSDGLPKLLPVFGEGCSSV